MTERAAEIARPMRVAVLSSASGGGAGIAARRLTHALNLRPDVQADFIDATALGGRLPPDVALPGSLSNRRITDTHYTVEYSGYVRGWLIEMLDEYDVINVHWASFLIGISELDELSRRGKSMLFTLHDYYYITGGCHYPAGCGRNEYGCFGCPQLDADRCDPAAVPFNLSIKKRIFSRPNVHLAAPSEFLVKKAITSGIIVPERAHVLRNAYESERGLEIGDGGDPVRIVLIADSLSEQRKGMPLAIDALANASDRFAKQLKKPMFVVDIIGQTTDDLEARLSEARFPHVLHGRITDHSKLVEIFVRANYLLTCSYEDNWPNILVEAGSYGCVPIVGPGHGCEEFVRVFSTGHIAKDYSPKAFSDELEAAINSHGRERKRVFSSAVVDMHVPENVASSYVSVMSDIRRDANTQKRVVHL